MSKPKKYMGVFYAHGASESPISIEKNRKDLEHFLKKRFHKKLGIDSSPVIHVFSGRQEHRSTWRGDWEKWQKSVVSRKHATTGDVCYHMFIVPEERCGRATASILGHALSAGRKLFLWDRKGGKLKRVNGVQAVDADDWTSGFRVTT